MIGTTVDGRYEILARLGGGAMGVVYRARHRGLDQEIALKVLRTDLGLDERVLERFRREARMASAIGHPNIAAVSDFGTLPDGSPYLAMELVSGRSLRAIVSEGPMELARVVAIAKQICDALGAAHERGIVHRDLKPDNVIVGERVKILDFGIAKIVNDQSALTATGEMVGTPYYMSPEQCHGRDVDSRSDVYALGAMIFEMLTGAPPFRGETLVAVVTAHLTEPPPELRGVPGAIDRLVRRCLAKEKDARPSSMAEVAKELEDAYTRAGSELGSASTIHGARPVGVGASVIVKRRPIALYAIAALGLGALTALGGWAIAMAMREEPRAPAPAVERTVEPEPVAEIEEPAAVVEAPEPIEAPPRPASVVRPPRREAPVKLARPRPPEGDPFEND